MRIAVLCNDRLGIPALQQLAQSGLARAAGTSDRSPEMVAIMRQVEAQARIPATIFTRKDFEQQLLAWLEANKPDVVLVKTFPFKIPASALNIPKHGFINFHYAPLPQYRGSNPLFWMVRAGITMGGIAVHRMEEQFDTGPLLLQQPVPFHPGSTFGICSTQLAYAGVQLTTQLLQGLQAGTLQPVAQEHNDAKWYGRPAAADLLVSWNSMNATQVVQLAKACNPWMKGAPARFKSWPVGITDASVAAFAVPSGTLPGTILELSPENGLIIACREATAVKVEVLYTEEGFFTGEKAALFGLKKGDRFD